MVNSFFLCHIKDVSDSHSKKIVKDLDATSPKFMKVHRLDLNVVIDEKLFQKEIPEMYAIL